MKSIFIACFAAQKFFSCCPGGKMYEGIAGFHMTSRRSCWCTLNKRILIISFVWETNLAAMSIVFCVSWDCEKTKNSLSYFIMAFSFFKQRGDIKIHYAATSF